MRYFPGTIAEDLSLSPLKDDIKGYTWEKLRADLVAGITVAFVTVPQAMAFALAAGLPLSCGLFASIYAAIIASLFGSCRHLVVGPTNVIAILVQFGTASILHSEFREVVGPERDIIALQILTQLTFLVGFFQFFASLFKLGRLIQFVSHSVVVGYLLGTALALAINQIYMFLGITPPDGAWSLFDKLLYFIHHIKEIHMPTALIGIGSLCLLVAFNKYGKKFPAQVVVILIAGAVVHLFGMSTHSDWGFFVDQQQIAGKVALVGDTGIMEDVFPRIVLPYMSLSMIDQLIPIAFAIALLSSLQSSLVAKSITSYSGQSLSVNQEILGLGLANIFSSFIGAMPSSGSIARSILIFRSGGKTRFAGIFSAMSVGLIVVALGFFVKRIPLTALSAILLLASTKFVQKRDLLLCLKSTKADRIVLIATVLSCLFFGLDIAFYVGVVISITFYLKKAAVPYFVECEFDDTGQIDRTKPAKKEGGGKIRVINVQGELFFGAADLFQRTLKSITRHDSELKVVILRLKNARDIDATSCLALEQLNQYLKESNRHLLLCGLTYTTWEVLSNSGTIDVIGKENLFIVEEKKPKLSLQHALIRANQLITDSEKKKDAQEIEKPKSLVEQLSS